MAKETTKAYGDHWTKKGDYYYGVVYDKDPATGKKKKSPRTKKFPNRILAKQWADREYAKMDLGIATATDKKPTIGEAAYWYKTYHLFEPKISNGVRVKGRKDWETMRRILDRVTVYYGGMPVATVTPVKETKTTTKEFSGGKRMDTFEDSDMEAYSEWRRDQNLWEHSGGREGVEQITINRDFELIRAFFRAAQRRYKLATIPKFPIIKSAEIERERTITKEEEERLLAVCVDRETIEVTRKGKTYKTTINAKRAHLKPLIIFAIESAMRGGEIRKLDWKDVDLKTGKITVKWFIAKRPLSRKVPINARMREVLEAIPDRTGRVFRIGDPKKAFATAVSRAGIEEELLFHDLRHTGTTRLVEGGTPYVIAMKITGHTQVRTFMRYMNQTDKSLQDTRERMDAYHEQLVAEYFADQAADAQEFSAAVM